MSVFQEFRFWHFFPPWYGEKGDQASIIGGAVEFINELHLVLRSLESKKKRRRISPSRSPSPRSLMPVTPPPAIPSSAARPLELSACSSSPAADVEVKINGSNAILRTLSKRIPGQPSKVISLLENLSFEILHLNISTMEETALYSFVVKVENPNPRFPWMMINPNSSLSTSDRPWLQAKCGGLGAWSSEVLLRGGSSVRGQGRASSRCEYLLLKRVSSLVLVLKEKWIWQRSMESRWILFFRVYEEINDDEWAISDYPCDLTCSSECCHV